jgi:DHA2 family multidrug resistance protein
MQAAIAPVAGVLADKVNPKLPAAVGIFLLGVSLWMNSRLSLYSEHAQIMLPLVVRGFAMGLLFSPLSTLALSEIPKWKMAQASGLFNVIRQIGGSFGVAILSTMLTRRMIYHTSMFGQAADAQSAVFQATSMRLQHFVQSMGGGTVAEAASRARALILMHVSQQSFVQAVDDDFFIAAVITLVALVPLLLLRRYRTPPTYGVQTKGEPQHLHQQPARRADDGL